MRNLSSVVDDFRKINGVSVYDFEMTGGGVEIFISRGIISASFFVPENGSQADIKRILANGVEMAGRGAGKGEGRKLLNDVVMVLKSEGITSLGVVDGNGYWDLQSDFVRREGRNKISHCKEW